MKSLIISGGGTKIVGQYAAASLIYPHFRPDILAGTSAGAIISLLLPCVDSNLANQKFLKLRPKDFWKVNPVTKNSNISIAGLIRAITSEESLGDMSNLNTYLKNVICYDSFYQNIVENQNIKHVYVSTVCFNTGHRAHIDLKECGYAEAIEWVVASASIPVFAQSYEYNNYYYYDGGVRNHIPSRFVLEEFGSKLSDIVSIYSRPEDYNIIDPNWKPTDTLTVLERTLDIMNMEISKRDQEDELKTAKELNLNLSQLFLPKVLESTYDTDPERLKILHNEGIKIAQQWISNNIKQ